MSLLETQQSLAKLAGRARVRHDDDPRYENRKRLRVRSIPELQVLPGGHMATSGGNDVVAYDSHVAQIAELLEPNPEWVEQAKAWVEQSKQKFLERMRVDKRDPSLQWDAVAREYTGPMFWPAAFRAQHFRSPLPLLECTVVEELGPPESDDDKRLQRQREDLAPMVAAAVAETLKSLGLVNAPQRNEQRDKHR